MEIRIRYQPSGIKKSHFIIEAAHYKLEEINFLLLSPLHLIFPNILFYELLFLSLQCQMYQAPEETIFPVL